MINQRGFNNSQEINFWISFYFFQKLDHSLFEDLEIFSPDSVRVNFEVLKLLHLCMDCHKICFKWYSKGVFMILRRVIFEYNFCSYIQKNQTCSRSFPRFVASGGLHLFGLGYWFLVHNLVNSAQDLLSCNIYTWHLQMLSISTIGWLCFFFSLQKIDLIETTLNGLFNNYLTNVCLNCRG